MDVIRLILRLVALVMILLLGACGSFASKKGELHTARTNSGMSTPTMGMLATQPARRMAEARSHCFFLYAWLFQPLKSMRPLSR